MNDLARKTIVGFIQLLVVLAVLLFLPAGTLSYWQGWVYLFLFFGSVALITLYLWRNDPELLQRRVKAGPAAEQERSQQLIQAFAALAFMGLFSLSALDHRYSWSAVPLPVVMLGDVLVVLGFFLVFVVYRENTFTAATIEVAEDQQVISTGPYAIIRHPMYSGALVMLVGTALALGSWWGLLMVVIMTLVIIWRLLDEERFLSANLPGYRGYREKVRYRLIPRVF